jgi:dienelactone hydrolase
MLEAMETAHYDPSARGQFPVGVRTIQAPDRTRNRVFPCEIWYPALAAGPDPAAWPAEARDAAASPSPGGCPLIIYSHHSGGHRRKATFLCTHLASHGYVVAALDHSEVVAPELAPRDGETSADRAARIDAIIASRVPDICFLIGYLLSGTAGDAAADLGLDPARIGLVGHSFGGWTVLATPDVEPRIGAVVALAPGGSSRPRPGILPLRLAFAWDRAVPALYVAAEHDVPVPVADVREIVLRAPAPKRLFVLRGADHQHFIDDVEGEHEALRAMSLPGDAAWIPAAMRPITGLCPGEQAHVLTRALALAHLDATLRGTAAAGGFLDDGAGDAAGAGIEHGPEGSDQRR